MTLAARVDGVEGHLASVKNCRCGASEGPVAGSHCGQGGEGFFTNAAMACGDGARRRLQLRFAFPSLAGKRYQCALLLGAVREWHSGRATAKEQCIERLT